MTEQKRQAHRNDFLKPTGLETRGPEPGPQSSAISRYLRGVPVSKSSMFTLLKFTSAPSDRIMSPLS